MVQTTHTSRRKLLYGLGLGSVGIATTSWTSRLAAAVTADPLTDAVNRAQASAAQTGLGDWTGAVGASFTIRDGASSYAVTLVSVTPLQAAGSRPAGLRPSALAATFQGSSVPAGNRTYTFVQGNGSQFQLFVGAKSMNGSTGQLVAILN
ncbi:MAG TPA: hypothetical protein VH331_01500 [Allosphingosinicella sp.]|nr:hypothetical protein [Allosphingosinicella sp.]